MVGVNQQNMNAFDFSLDAQDFRSRLWKKLKTKMVMTSVQELEDDEREWVNAAGRPVQPGSEGELV